MGSYFIGAQHQNWILSEWLLLRKDNVRVAISWSCRCSGSRNSLRGLIHLSILIQSCSICDEGVSGSGIGLWRGITKPDNLGPARLEPPVTTGSFLPTYFLAVVSTSSGRINNQFPFISCQPQAWNAAGPRGLVGDYGRRKNSFVKRVHFFLQGVHWEGQFFMC